MYGDSEENGRAPPPPPQRQEPPPVAHHPAGFTVKAPNPEKREQLMRAAEEGNRKFVEYQDSRTNKIRALTQGPSKPVGGQYLTSCELDKKWVIQEREAKKQQALADYQKKQRRHDYQQGERERKDREIQEKKAQARELTNKQTRRENDRNLAHGQVVREQRLSRFTQYQQYTTTDHSIPVNPRDLQERKERERNEALKQQKLDEAARKRRSDEYRKDERVRQETEFEAKKMQARNLANRQASRERERASADHDNMIEKRLGRFSQY